MTFRGWLLIGGGGGALVGGAIAVFRTLPMPELLLEVVLGVALGLLIFSPMRIRETPE